MLNLIASARPCTSTGGCVASTEIAQREAEEVVLLVPQKLREAHVESDERSDNTQGSTGFRHTVR